MAIEGEIMWAGYDGLQKFNLATKDIETVNPKIGTIYDMVFNQDALYLSTSRLPKITIKNLNDESTTLVGKNTISAMESGVFWGYVCMIEGLIKKLKKTYKDSKVVATGGLSDIFKNEIKSIDLVNKNLTIFGLAYIYTLNK